jgi:HEAT repeat protein
MSTHLQPKIYSEDPRERMAAVVSIRSLGPDEATPLLLEATRDPLPMVRIFATIGLGKKKGEGAYERLIDLLNNDPEVSVRAEAAGALGDLGDQRATEHLVRAYHEDVDWIVRYSVIVSLGLLQDIRGYDVIRDGLKAKENLLQEAAVGALGNLGDEKAQEVLFSLLPDAEGEMRYKIAKALGHLLNDPKTGDMPKCRSALEFLKKDADERVAQIAAYHLDEFTNKFKAEA